MELSEIKEAIESGKVVCWNNDSYTVIKGGPTGLLVVNENKWSLFAVKAGGNEYYILKPHENC